MENITTELLKITPHNPNMVCGILAIIAVFTIMYVILWVKFNYDRKAKLIALSRKLDQMHNARMAQRFKNRRVKGMQVQNRPVGARSAR